MKSPTDPEGQSKTDALQKTDMNSLRDMDFEERLQAGLEKFKQDNKGKTWEDLAREQDAHLGKPSCG